MKKTVSVMVKLTTEEKEMVERLARRRGLSLSAYLRTIIYEKAEQESRQDG